MPKESSLVCLVGVGARTAVGHTASSSAAAVRAGIAGFADHLYMLDKAGDPMVVAMASYLADDVTSMERMLALALPAALEALSPLSRLAGRIKPIPVLIGLPAVRPGLPVDLGERMVNRFKDEIKERCVVSQVETISAGHSAGLMALEVGWRRIQEGSIEICLAGGVDSYLEPETLEWVEECDQLHSAGGNAWGFIPGEAAGFCLLVSQTTAERYELRILGKVLAIATAWESNLIKTETVCIGQGLTEAIKQILLALPSPRAKIDQIICDMNGEAYRADEYGFTVARVSERLLDATDFLAPADCWGDVGAASGPLFISLAVAAGLKGYSKGPYTLVWTSSEGGERSAALIHVESHMRA